MISMEEILQLIENKNISITELARISGIPQATLQRNLNKKTKMAYSTYDKIISILNEIEGIYDKKNYSSALLGKSYDSIASDSHVSSYGSNVDFLDKIKTQEKTIENLLDQNKKLLEIISKLLENK